MPYDPTKNTSLQPVATVATALPLYGSTNTMQCGTCHDPHNKASVDKYFLRGMLTGSDASYICLKCHTK